MSFKASWFQVLQGLKLGLSKTAYLKQKLLMLLYCGEL